MTIYYLYIKTHNKTGLKYLGKTTSPDPHKYIGSGKDWKTHLKEHGRNFTTEILKECSTNDELSQWGRYYSKLWDIAKTAKFRKIRSESQRGSDNPKFDHTLYVFEHKDTGIREFLTKYDFRKKYNIAHSHVSNLVSGYNYTKSHKGWTIIK